MKAGRIILRALLILVISVTLGLTVYTWNARRVMHNELPMPFGIGASVVLTGSMEPTLKVNDLVIVKTADSYEVGDIVVFQNGDELIIHRIVELDIENERVTTKGDANDIDDSSTIGRIPLTAIKGKYSFRIPFVGLIIKGLKTVPGIIIILALSVYLMIRSWKNERKESEQDIEDLKAEIAKLKGESGETPESLQEQIKQLKEELGQNGHSDSKEEDRK